MKSGWNNILRANIYIVSFGKIVSFLGTLLIYIIFARNISQYDMGLFFLALSYAGIISLVAQAGYNQSVFRHIGSSSALDTKKISTAILAMVVTFGILLSILTITIGFCFDWKISSERVLSFSEITSLVIWIILSPLQSILGEMFRAKNKIREAVFFGAQGGVTGGTLSLIAAFAGIIIINAFSIELSLASAIGLLALGQLICIICALYQGRAFFDFRNLFQAILYLKSLRIFSGYLMVAGVFTYLIGQSDIWLVKTISSPIEIANYGVAISLAKYVSAANMLIYSAIPAIVIDLYNKKKFEDLTAVMRKVASFSAIAATIIFVILLFAGRIIINSLYGESYNKSYEVLIILSIGHLVNSLLGNPLLIVLAAGGDKMVFLLNAAVAIVSIIFGLILGNWLGSIGIALAFALGYSLYGIALWFYVLKKHNLVTNSYFSFRV